MCIRDSCYTETGASLCQTIDTTPFLPMNILSALKFINTNQHEIAMNFPTIWRTLLWTTFVIYISAFMILFYKCVRAVHKLSPVSSMLIGLYLSLIHI